MVTLGAVSFAVPWALAALLVLPVIWWLLRVTPPLPTIIAFPPVRLLMGLGVREESAAKTPLWLLIVRLLLAVIVILAAAHPLWDAGAKLTGKGPVIVIIDDGWAAAANWAARKALVAGLADQAERESRPMAVITTAAPASGAPDTAIRLMPAGEARTQVEGLQPKPWPTDRARALANLLKPGTLADKRPGDVIWLSDGLEENSTAMANLTGALQRLGGVSVVSDPPGQRALVLKPPVADGKTLKLAAERSWAGGIEPVWVRALDDDGRLLARQPMTFAAGQARAEAGLTLPTELLNRLQRLDIENAETVGAVVLTDERWRRRPVGLVSGGGASEDQPLLSDLYYLRRALQPFTELRQGRIADLLKRPLSVMVLADPGRLEKTDRTALDPWINAGGVVVRFAGPLLAKTTADQGGVDDGSPLLPVRLRQGDRVIGGAMSWREPAKLAPFEATGPFFGFSVPADVTVLRQVLAQPALDLADKTWARLEDGTPLVTAERRGKGWLVLVHTTANAQWSSLPLSGLFVDMLRRLVGLSHGVEGKAVGAIGAARPPLEPLSSLDGFGRNGPATATARAIAADNFDTTVASPAHPPGYYGLSASRRALNLSAGLAPIKSIGPLASGVSQAFYGKEAERDFRPWLLTIALILALVDFAASLWLRGLLYFSRLALPAVLLVLAGSGEAKALEPDAFALGNSLETRLAYVLTGDVQIDEISAAGLRGLNVILRRRTAAELGQPQGINPARDELAFFPLLYWPVTPGSVLASEAARSNVNKYLRNGGTILFDTRSAEGGAGAQVLRQLARSLDIPPLVPVGPNHVLTRAFYLIKEFPGRWNSGSLWVERAGERVNDGVSPVIAGGNDWAAAWAMDETQRPLYPVVPGGERQREMSYRFGVNLVMYTLTGNYKADQVHVPEIIKRLGK
ncbi:MAG: DUF4159 domain-containing protein [Rhodospirillales bacterium]|nr:DUF4159 domain-containing protein [Rhodospirillales bacterium]